MKRNNTATIRGRERGGNERENLLLNKRGDGAAFIIDLCWVERIIREAKLLSDCIILITHDNQINRGRKEGGRGRRREESGGGAGECRYKKERGRQKWYFFFSKILSCSDLRSYVYEGREKGY